MRIFLRLMRPPYTLHSVDGGWSSWLSWEPCSASCGASRRRRIRRCDSPTPRAGGADCPEEEKEEEEEECQVGECRECAQVKKKKKKTQTC